MIRIVAVTIALFIGMIACNLQAKPEPKVYTISPSAPDKTPALSGTGKTFYVDIKGSDSNPGTQKKPWATIQYAGETAKPADTILIRGGEYHEEQIWLRSDSGHCGNKNALLTIRNFPEELVLLTNGNRPFIVECDNLRVQGLHFRNGKSLGSRGVNRNNLQFVNNTFKGSGYAYDAISTEGSNILIEGNECDINGNTQGTQGHCYYIHHGANITLRNNIAKGATGYGIHIFDQRRSEDPPGFERLIQNVVVEGNTLRDSEQRAGVIVAAYDHARVENVIIRNNLVYNNNGLGIVIRSASKNVQVYNNTVFHNGNHAIGVYAGEENTIDGLTIKNNIFVINTGRRLSHVETEGNNMIKNIVLENNFYGPEESTKLDHVFDEKAHSGSPEFVNPEIYDLHLKASSPAIGFGAYEFQKK
jgi:parallel beta-helix repeat protein